MVQDCRFVVRLEGVYEDAQCVYLVQQLCTGGDLRTVLNVRESRRPLCRTPHPRAIANARQLSPASCS